MIASLRISHYRGPFDSRWAPDVGYHFPLRKGYDSFKTECRDRRGERKFHHEA